MMKSTLYKNSYPPDFVDKCIKNFLDIILTQKVILSTVPKKDLMIVLRYLDIFSLQILTRINGVMKKNSPIAILELCSRVSAS